jgi:hypothetical protein
MLASFELLKMQARPDTGGLQNKSSSGMNGLHRVLDPQSDHSCIHVTYDVSDTYH